MRRLLISMLILLLLAVSVQAACDKIEDMCEKEFLDKGYNSLETFEKDGIIYSSQFYSERMVVLYVDNQKYIIDGECSCERSDDAKLLYCIDEIETVDEDIDDGKLDKVKFVNGKSREYIEFVFCEAKPMIEVDVDIPNDEPNLNDVIDVYVNLENAGTKEVTDLVYTFPVPEGLSYISNPDLRFDGKNIYFEQSLYAPHESDRLELEFRVKNTKEFRIETLLDYVFQDEPVQEKDTLKITVVAPYDVDIETPGSVSKNEQFDMEIEVENELDDQGITIEEFSIKLPDGIEVYDDEVYTSQDWMTLIKNSGFSFETEDDRSFMYAGHLDKEEKKYNLQHLVATKEGKHIIEAKYRIKAKGEIYEETENIAVNVKTYDVPDIKFSVTDEIEGGDEYWVRVTIENKDENIDFNDLSLKITSPLFKTEFIEKADIPKDSDVIELFNKVYRSDEVLEEESYTLKLTGKYYDPERNAIDVDMEDTILIAPPSANLTITIISNDTKIIPGEEISVDVEIENKEDIYVGTIRGSDDIPAELEITGGRIASSISLEGKEKKKIYEYKLKVPEGYSDDEIVITTNLISQIGPRTYTNEKSITLDVNTSMVYDRAKGEIVDADEYFAEQGDDGDDDESTQQNETNTTTGLDTGDSQGTLIPQEEKGFFSRIFESIGNWINSIFS